MCDPPASPPAANVAPPSGPAQPSVAPAFGGNPPSIEPTAGAATGDGGRRGKPKRRRFNFNVLENLEKMVQPKGAEPLPTTNWTPPAATPTATPTTPPSFSANLPATPAFQSAPIPAEVGAKSPTEEASSLPLPFGDRSQITAKAAEGEPTTVEPPVDDSAEPGPSDAFASAQDQEPVAFETEHPRARDSRRDAKGSMRSMMFGEEMTASQAQAEEPAASEPAEPAQEPPSAETPWPS